MTATTILKPVCDVCSKPAIIDFSFFVKKSKEGKELREKFIQLKCKHVVKEVQADQLGFDDIYSESGKSLLKFQKEVCAQSVKENFRVLLNLQMGLGKTICSIALVKKYWKLLSPVLIVCRSGLVTQIAVEWLDWMDGKPIQLINSGKDKPEHKYFKAFVMSMDLMRNLKWLDEFEPKTIIIDEVQNFKNPDAERTKHLQRLAAKATYVMGLSGTPIKNHFGEYFNILNMIDPKNFSNRSQFYEDFVDYYYDDNGKLHTGGVKQSRYAAFKQLTDRYIIRRTREEVLPDLPKIWRTYQFCNLTKKIADSYRKELGTYLDAYNDSMGAEGQQLFKAKTEINASIMRMRQIVGLAKVDPTVDFVREFLDSSNGNKIVIFIHHIDVGTILQIKLDALLKERGLESSLRIEGGISSDASWKIEQEFKNNPNRRVLVASTLAAGEGKNFQFCSDAIMMERQWNPPNEEQAEARFTRIGSVADKVNITYVVAYGTVDEIFAKLVEKKRTILKQVHEGVWTDAMQSEIMTQLQDILATEGMSMFRM